MQKALLLCFVVSACSVSGDRFGARSSNDRVAAEFALEEEFVPRLREIAEEYSDWTRLGDAPLVAPTSCIGPPPPAPLLSESRDYGTHGRKLYFLYARDVAAYRTWKESDQPVGQAFVKQSFEPVIVAPESEEFMELKYQGKATLRRAQGWKLGEERDLFVMYKLAPDTPNTDAGWVYGTVTPDGEVTSAGRVANCMGCHVDADRDRMFGAEANEFVAESSWDANEQHYGDETESR